MRTGAQNKYETNYQNIWVIVLFCIVLIAFRGSTVGIDTAAYGREFYMFDFSSLTDSRYSSERGFMLLNVLLKEAGFDFWVLTLLEALVVMLPATYLIRKYSKNPYLSFFYFIAMDYFCFSLTGMRQAFALGITMIAFEFAQRKKFIPFVLLVLLAMVFHKTAMVFLPVYFISRISLKKKYIFWIIVGSFAVFLMKEPIRTIMRELARIDHKAIDTGGTGMYLFFVAIALVGIVFSKAKWNEKMEGSVFFYMLFCAIAVYPVLQYNPTILRLHYYYSVMLIILIPNILDQIHSKIIRYGCGSVFFVVGLYYMFAYPLQNMGITPYRFMW